MSDSQDDPQTIDPSLSITPENISAAYSKLFGGEAPSEYVNQVQNLYQNKGKDMSSLKNDMVTSAATANMPFANKPGDNSAFTGGAAYYQGQGYTPGGYTYEGVPTQFIDPKTGKVVANYGTIQEGPQVSRGGSDQTSDWTWNNASATPEGYATGLAQANKNTGGYSDALRATAIMAALAAFPYLAPELMPLMIGAEGAAGAAGGAGALGALGTGAAEGAGALGVAGGDIGAFTAADAAASVAGEGAFNMADALGMTLDQAVNTGLISSTGELTSLGTEALMGLGGEATGAAGFSGTEGELTASDALKYANRARQVANLAKGALGSGAVPSAAGTGAVPSAAGTGAVPAAAGVGATAAAASQNGAWNTFLNPTHIKQDIVAQKPIMQNPELAKLYKDLDPYLNNQLAQAGMTPSNLGGGQMPVNFGSNQQPAQPSANYFTYGSSSPMQMANYGQQLINGAPLTAKKGGAINKAKGGRMHDSEFDKTAMGGNYGALTAQAMKLLNPSFDVGQLAGFKDGGQEHIPEFITGATGHYVKGRGDGQSDDIPAMLADGEYVFDADTVAQLGNGSSDAGAKVLDKMRESIRAHKRSADVDEIPPKSKSPLEYIKEGMKRK